ncbi:metalloregulator ArsR/SmtB family transcription factor [Novosphingobium sp. 1949]|uniref:Metalloregulator ArsR/SmtB family transcription factor n=1 Tax=Novosphingobium organovorum TaxID=2930092 RepID=A0ABT0BAN4_9SPHN|nr:metalloregulator ArsR/SmtB family transcription factor [Novosphingobium organovorum]MCJ2182119.1 metalloregulator ArsR/SmtB family transcription factor [Novosphingobium organovorum]
MQIDPLLRALSEPTRLRIMRLLAHMELSVGELAQVLGQSQPRVSRHVRILCDAGLSERRKEGSWVFLRSAVSDTSQPEMGAAAARLLAIAERDDPEFATRCRTDRRHLATIREAREANAQAYFARHAPEWDTLRQLHGADEPVEAALIAALGDAPQGLGALLDIGTGTGRMAELLAPNAVHITALDRNPEMLQIARARLQALPAGKVDLVRGDFAELPFDSGTFDTVLFHQVLHFAPSPGPVLGEAARVTREGGRIAIVDLAAHEREDLRERHAHARLGFSDEQMAGLMTGAGFTPEPAIALPGDPLTVKIWTARRNASPAPSLPADTPASPPVENAQA